jgi:hypothetical protein
MFPLPFCHASPHCAAMLPRPPVSLLMILAALALDSCGVEKAQPAPAVDQDHWGHLAPDPDRPQQAEAPPAAPPG